MGVHSIPLGVRILGRLLPLSLFPLAVGGALMYWDLQGDIALYLVGLSLSAALLAAGLIARTIVRPLQALSRGAERVAHGDFDVRVPVTTGDELGQLAQSFNAMAGSLATYRDDLVRAEHAATLGRLASTVAHEVRNPLNAIRGCVELLRLKRPDDELLRHHADIIAAEVETLNAFVGDFLRLARLGQPNRSATNLSDLVAGKIALHAAEADALGVRVHVQADPALPAVSADAQQIGAVVENLTRNAFDAMPDGGDLDVVLRSDGEMLELTFTDSGCGIAPEVAPQIFTPFFTTKREGTGLGLPTSRRIVELHGGRIWFSPARDQGTTFHVRLPVETPGGGDSPVGMRER